MDLLSICSASFLITNNANVKKDGSGVIPRGANRFSAASVAVCCAVMTRIPLANVDCFSRETFDENTTMGQ